MSDRSWLDQMWYAGYCDDTVEFAATTALNHEGGQQRLAWMRKHVLECRDCAYANMLKGMEATVAEQLGFSEEFQAGGNVTLLPGYPKEFERQMKISMELGIIDDGVVAWMARGAKRRGSPWPGHLPH